MIYLVIVITGIDLIPFIKVFTNKKEADFFAKQEAEKEYFEGYYNSVYIRQMPWKNTKKEFIRYANHYLG